MSAFSDADCKPRSADACKVRASAFWLRYFGEDGPMPQARRHRSAARPARCSGERPQTLQATALVNDAYLWLVGPGKSLKGNIRESVYAVLPSASRLGVA